MEKHGMHIIWLDGAGDPLAELLEETARRAA
jgi:hypothetical protein